MPRPARGCDACTPGADVAGATPVVVEAATVAPLACACACALGCRRRVALRPRTWARDAASSSTRTRRLVRDRDAATEGRASPDPPFASPPLHPADPASTPPAPPAPPARCLAVRDGSGDGDGCCVWAWRGPWASSGGAPSPGSTALTVSNASRVSMPPRICSSTNARSTCTRGSKLPAGRAAATTAVDAAWSRTAQPRSSAR